MPNHSPRLRVTRAFAIWLALAVVIIGALNVVPMSWNPQFGRAGAAQADGTGTIPAPTPTGAAGPSSTSTTTFSLPLASPVQLASSDNALVISVPTNAIPGQPGDEVTVTVTPQTSQIGTSIQSAVTLLSYVITVTDNGSPVTQFTTGSGLTVTLTYDPNQVSSMGVAPQSLHLVLIDDNNVATVLPTTVNQGNDTVSATVPHLSTLNLTGAHTIKLPWAPQGVVAPQP